MDTDSRRLRARAKGVGAAGERPVGEKGESYNTLNNKQLKLKI